MFTLPASVGPAMKPATTEIAKSPTKELAVSLIHDILPPDGDMVAATCRTMKNERDYGGMHMTPT